MNANLKTRTLSPFIGGSSSCQVVKDYPRPETKDHRASQLRRAAPGGADGARRRTNCKGLERRFRGPLRRQGYDAAQAGALVSVTVAAVFQHGPIDRFLEQVASNGQRLAQRNVPRNAVARALREFPLLLEEAAGGCFAPAREQLQVATILKVNEAFYQVHEAERLGLFWGFAEPGLRRRVSMICCDA